MHRTLRNTGSGLAGRSVPRNRLRPLLAGPQPALLAHSSLPGPIVAVVLLVVLSSRGLALGGSVEVRNSAQQGRTQSGFYRENVLELETVGDQRVPFGRSVVLGVNGRFLRQQYRSRTAAMEYEMRRNTDQGGATLDFVRRKLRLGLEGIVFQRRSAGPDADTPLLSRRQLGASANYVTTFARLGASSLLTLSRHSNPEGPETRDQEWTGWLDGRALAGRLGEFGYRVSSLIDRDLEAATRLTQVTQTLSYSGSGKFAQDRGTANVKSVMTLFDQQYRQTALTGDAVRLPLSGGFRLDDTPEQADPLEPALTPVPELYDGNYTTPTSINIGDSATRVRDFGGDYRNIQFDFGDSVAIRSADLYVDRTVLNYAFFQWSVFVSNDPDGRVWTALTSGTFDLQYREWGVGRQGWSVTFTRPVAARFFKLVDEKLGPTIDDLFVTEMEVRVQQTGNATTESERTSNWRLDGALGYDLSSSVHAGYDLFYRRRDFSGEPGSLDQWHHGVSVGWHNGTWSAAGRYELTLLDGKDSRGTNTDAQNFSIRRGQSNQLAFDLFLSRVRDEGQGSDKTTKNASLGADLPVAPALRFQQRVSVGRLADRSAGLGSTSLATSTSATGQPVPSVNFTVGSTQRWVSREAGTGYSRFNDTTVNLVWRPVPFISFESQLQYELRETGDWITRNSVGWSPLNRGNLKIRLNASHYRETLIDQTQRSGGIQLEWAGRPGLALQAGMEQVVLTAPGQKLSPLNMDLRGRWRF
jgi:hypothetical protein